MAYMALTTCQGCSTKSPDRIGKAPAKDFRTVYMDDLLNFVLKDMKSNNLFMTSGVVPPKYQTFLCVPSPRFVEPWLPSQPLHLHTGFRAIRTARRAKGTIASLPYRCQ